MDQRNVIFIYKSILFIYGSIFKNSYWWCTHWQTPLFSQNSRKLFIYFLFWKQWNRKQKTRPHTSLAFILNFSFLVQLTNLRKMWKNKQTKTQTEKLKRTLKNQTHLSNCLFKNWLTESLRLRQSIKQREQENGPGSKIWPLRSIIWWARAENCWRTDEDWPIALIRSFSMTIPPFWKTRLWESIVTIAALWSKIIIADLVFSSPITCWFPYSSSIKSSWAGGCLLYSISTCCGVFCLSLALFSS